MTGNTAGPAGAKREAARRRSEEWRDRRRRGEIVVGVVVSRETVRALRQIGLVADGADRDHQAIADGAAHFLHAVAPSVAGMGAALFPAGVAMPGDDAG